MAVMPSITVSETGAAARIKGVLLENLLHSALKEQCIFLMPKMLGKKSISNRPAQKNLELKTKILYGCLYM